ASTWSRPRPSLVMVTESPVLEGQVRRTTPGLASRRLLLISYHFAPGREAGALRWVKFATLAAERGWSVDVISLDPPEIASPDSKTLAALPKSVRVYGIRNARLPIDRLVQFAVALRARLSPVEARTAQGTPQRAAAGGARPESLHRSE